MVSADRFYNAAAAVADGSFERDLVVAVEDEVIERSLVTPRVDDLSDEVRAI